MRNNEPISYTKEISVNSREFKKFYSRWVEMGGEEVPIESLYAIYSPTQLLSFASYWIDATSQVKAKPELFNTQKWRNEANPLREWVYEKYKETVARYPWNADLDVWIIAALHGTNVPVAESIITTGFAALGGLDPGWYGKGIYFTGSVRYALPYFGAQPSPAVLFCYVITGNTYPVIEHPNGNKSLKGAAMMKGVHSHYVLCTIDGVPVTEQISNYFDEIVIEQKTGILPFYLVKIDRSQIASIAKTFMDDKLKTEKNNASTFTQTMKQSQEVFDEDTEERRLIISEDDETPYLLSDN